MKTPYNVLIIGAGKIGAFFDSPRDEDVLTHAHAFAINQSFRLVGFVDTDLNKASEAAKIWGGEAFAHVSEAFARVRSVDVVVVATPDASHARIFRECSEHPVRIIVMEKPIATSLEEARAMVDCCAQKGLPVLVNYSRRFVKEFQALHDRIKRGEFGAYVTGSGYYGKGIVHNGSHMIDLVRFLVGEVREAVSLGAVVDLSEDDPSVSAQLVLDHGEFFFLHAVDSRVVTVFEADMFFEKVRIKIVDSGAKIEEADVAEDVVFPGYKVFRPGRVLATSLHCALAQAVENVEGHLNHGEPLLSDMNNGYRAFEIALNLAHQGSRG